MKNPIATAVTLALLLGTVASQVRAKSGGAGSSAGVSGHSGHGGGGHGGYSHSGAGSFNPNRFERRSPGPAPGGQPTHHSN